MIWVANQRLGRPVFWARSSWKQPLKFERWPRQGMLASLSSELMDPSVRRYTTP